MSSRNILMRSSTCSRIGPAAGSSAHRSRVRASTLPAGSRMGAIGKLLRLHRVVAEVLLGLLLLELGVEVGLGDGRGPFELLGALRELAHPVRRGIHSE